MPPSEHDSREPSHRRNEETPLLLSSPPPAAPPDVSTTSSTTSSSLTSTILYFMAIHFLLAFSEIIVIAPFISLYEISLCRSYYDVSWVRPNEERCKIPEIQGPLATTRGWKAMFDTLPVLLVAVPFGKIGDRRGRRGILGLALIGVLISWSCIFIVCAIPQTIPLRWVWLSSVPLLCGGGLNAASSYMWALAAECIPSDQRSHGFYLVFSAFYVAELFASYLAAITMDISPWIPCGFAMLSLIVCLVLIWISAGPRRPEHPIKQPEDLPSAGCATNDPRDPAASHSQHSIIVIGLKTALSSRNVLLTIPVFLVGILRYTTLNVLIQYASVRFNMKLSTGATFYTETALVNITMYLFVIPQATQYIRKKYDVRPQAIDITLVRTSVCLMCIGSLAIGFAPSAQLLSIGVLIFAAGFGSRVSALSLISYWISDNAKATLYAAIVVLESIGHAIGDPAMQQIFAASLFLSPFWKAMPFFVAAGAYGVAVISTSLISIGNSDKDIESESDSGTD